MTLCLPLLLFSNATVYSAVSDFCSGRPDTRHGSPVGASTLMTVAPMSHNKAHAAGAAITVASSTTVMPCRIAADDVAVGFGKIRTAPTCLSKAAVLRVASI